MIKYNIVMEQPNSTVVAEYKAQYKTVQKRNLKTNLLNSCKITAMSICKLKTLANWLPIYAGS
ncbi:MAG: hypothetical protein LBS61_00480 [Endomicrobium sp.]|jgi:hypothetical protein|nr:hypothetical protein [Endomicrobium sp.]